MPLLSDDEVFGSVGPQPDQNQNEQNTAQQKIGQNTPPVNNDSQLLSDDEVFGSAPSSDYQKDSTSFSKKPTWKNLGNAIVGAGADAVHEFTEPFAHVGRMVYGDWQTGKHDPIVTESVPETLGNVAQLAIPFVAGAAEAKINDSKAAAASKTEDLGSAPSGTESSTPNPGPKTSPGGAAPTQTQLRDMAQRTYKAADEAGGALPASQHNELIDLVSEHAMQAPETEAWFGKNPFNSLSEKAEKLRDTPLSFKGASEIDKKLTSNIQKERLQDGTYTPEGQQWIDIQDKLHELMARQINGENATMLGPDWKPINQDGFALQNKAKQLWSAQAQMGRLQRMVENASMMSNPAVSLQVKARQMVQSKMFGTFNPQTQTVLLKTAANPSFAGELLRMGASRIPAFLGLGKGPLHGVATSIGSTAVRNLQERLAFRPVEKEIDRIGNSVELPVLDQAYNGPTERIIKKNGGRIKTHAGKVVKKPVSYPALEAMRKKS